VKLAGKLAPELAVARRTLRQAEAWFEDVSPVLPGETRRQVAEEIKDARKRALAFANGVTDAAVADVDRDREAALRELCEVRDGYAQLIKDGQAGRITAAEFSAGFDDLESRELRCGNTINGFTDAVAQVTEVEEAPLDYADDYAERNPNLLHEFSF